MPFIKLFKNQLDEIIIQPGFSKYDSNSQEANDYRTSLGWKHLFEQTFSTKLNLGVRYTQTEDKEINDSNNNWGGFGEIEFLQNGETYTAQIGFLRDLSVGTNGQLINVNRVMGNFDKKFEERFGLKFYGSFYYTNEESSDVKGEDTIFFELTPSIYYLITKNHSLELAYDYQNQKELDEPGNPTTVRSRIYLGLNLGFPYKWD